MWRLLILLMLVSPANSKSNPRTSVAGKFCSQERYPAGIATNLIFEQPITTMLMQVVGRRKWGRYNTSKAGPLPQLRASWQCHEDLSPKDCCKCMSAAKMELEACFPSVSGGVYLDGCMIRYYSGDGGDVRIVDAAGKVVCGAALGRPSSDDTVMMQEFVRKVNLSVWDVAMNASAMGTGHNAVLCRGGVEDVYALGQCWSASGRNECLLCFIMAAEGLSGNCGTDIKAIEGRAMFEDCYMKYSVEKFFDNFYANEADDWTGGKIMIAGVLSSTIFALIAIFFVYLCYRRQAKTKRDFHCKTSTNVYNSSLNFKYEILERATNYFDQSRKLGQGGSGSVFKGILPDERIVAVKRLFFSTRQWVDEFFNEVNLIHDIDHKNLVKLLGCSIEGPESLLVYEFVPNRSLDQIIFDKKNPMTTLVWQQRFDIITGTAEGLAYLHEGCGLRIIHRDVKASNVLLDENFMPKIGDFGLARSVTNDRTHISTGIAGTLGYMAPEYLVRGQLTEKADVYAFGVLIIEIVSGRRNSAFTVGSNSLLHNVWKLYKEDKILESVDPTLRGFFNPREASNALQIGLLCSQASVSIRPTMFEVIEMLNGRMSEVPAPNQPPFLNSSMLTSENELRSDSSGQIQSEISCSFTANSSTIYDSICHTSIA